MSADGGKALEPDDQLDEVIAAYLEALEAGQAPDRKELLARYPSLAPDLEAFFADEKQFDSLVAPLRVQTPLPGTALNTPPTRPIAATPPPAKDIRGPDLLEANGGRFGDYELLEEIARGGMGIVFKARQIRLNRIVALKMIRNGQLAYAEEIQRFKLEAEAAANLDHPNIVPIYEIGDIGGQHFFSMKLIEGGNLTQRLAAYRLPDGPRSRSTAGVDAKQRQAARLIATVAHAIAYAHERGLLHRDLKPANILVDAQGQPHITDFGLVKRVGHPPPNPESTIEPATGAARADSLTQSGIAVGTPNYMAPEQAAGPKNALTTAADVYSLGAILYEMLTGRPPFRADTPLETLLLVLEHEPERPRILCPTMDRDLETICLKCLDKNPHKRYAGAEALAEDLERYLVGEPILARPAGPAEWLWRWCRRNRSLAAGVGLAAASLLTVAIVSFLFFLREASHAKRLRQEKAETAMALDLARRKEAETATALELARRKEIEAEQHAQEEEKQRRKAEANALEVDKQRRRAEANAQEEKKQRQLADESFRQAHRAVGEFCIQLGEIRLAQYAGLQPVRKAFLEASLKYYDGFIRQRGKDPTLRAELADTKFRVAFITNVIGSQTEALARYQEARAIYEELVAADPKSAALRAGLGRTCINMGLLLDALGKPRESLEAQEKARDLFDRLSRQVKKPAAYRSSLAATYTNLGTLYRTIGRLPDSVDAFRKALAIHEELVRNHPGVSKYKGQLAVGHVNMGVMYGVLGDEGKALDSYRAAWKLQNEIARAHPDQHENQRDLAMSYRRIGNRLCATGKLNDGLRWLNEGHTIVNKLVKSNPEVTEFQVLLGVSSRSLGHAYRDKGDLDKALGHYGAARQILETLTAAHPKVWPIQSELAQTYFFLGVVNGRRGQPSAQLASLRKARAVHERLVQANPDNMHYRDQLAQTLYSLGNVLGDMGSHDLAARALRQAVEHQRHVFDRAPQVVEYARDLSHYLTALGDAENKRGRVGASLRTFHEGRTLLQGLLEAQPRNMLFECDLSDLLVRMDRAYRAAKQPALARACLEQARAIRSRHVDVLPHERHMRNALGSIYFDLALVNSLLNQKDAVESYYHKARDVWCKLLETYPDEVAYRKNLCATLHNLALNLAGTGRSGEGAAAMRQAIIERRKQFDRQPKNHQVRMQLAGHYGALAWMLRLERKAAEAVEATLERQKLCSTNPKELFAVACDLALAAQTVGDGKTPLNPTARTEQARYCALAVEALQRAVDSGFHDPKAIQNNPDLALLRDRDDYKALLARFMK
jgi:serine/threonine-protein kinase